MTVYLEIRVWVFKLPLQHGEIGGGGGGAGGIYMLLKPLILSIQPLHNGVYSVSGENRL